MILFKTLIRKMVISDVTGNIIRFVKPNVKINNLNFTTSSKHIRGKIVSLLYFNKYEKEEVQMIQEHMRTDLPIIDIGTSLGVVATNAAHLSSKNIVCVEANPNLKEIISDNLLSNGVTENRFSVVNAAICDTNQAGEAIYFSSRGSNELGRICDAETPGAIKVNTVVLSDIVKKNISEDFILISDVEGAEAAFLYSDSIALKTCNQLFIELHPVNWNGKELSVAQLRGRIETLGFIENDRRGMNFYYSRDAKK